MDLFGAFYLCLFIYHSFIMGICEERFKDEEGSQTDNCRKNISDKENSQCKETISQDLLCLKNSKEARCSRAE